MRKLSLMGLGLAATLTMALGPASPAKAVVAPPGSVVEQVCGVLPGAVTDLANSIFANASQVASLGTDVADAKADVDTKLGDVIGAIIAHLQTVDRGGNVEATAAIVNARLSDYSDAVAEWVSAWMALNTAELEQQALDIHNTVLGGLQTGLSC